MENLSYYINKYLLNLLDSLEKTNNEKILLDLGSELKYNVLFKILNEKLFNMALEQGKLINSFFGIKSIPRDSILRLYPDFLQQGKSKVGCNNEQIFPGILLFKGTLVKVLESLKLEETKKIYIKELIIDDPEINEKLYFSEDELSNFDKDLFEIILKKELKEKCGNKPIIINKNDN